MSYHKEDDITRTISDYFQKFFSANGATNVDIVQDVIHPFVSSEMNTKLILIPTDDEIRAATLSIHADKAPGPDGFTGGFFHYAWNIIGPDVIREIRDLFSSGSFPGRMNETYIRLIPKISGPRKVADYRPISLCNTYYKIVAKNLTKRLQPILNLSDNVLITHEILHYLKISGARKRGAIAVKTVMSKAYDHIEWCYYGVLLVSYQWEPTRLCLPIQGIKTRRFIISISLYTLYGSAFQHVSGSSRER